MTTRPKVTVVGSFNMDLLIRTPRMPVKGETILGGPFITGPGGKGANQAVAAARLDADVTMVVKLGQDAFGDQAAANLAKEGIRPGFVLRDGASHTGVAFIIVDNEGENMIVVALGTNAQLTPADIDAARGAIADADVALFQLESPLETVTYAIHVAHEAGTTVVLNPAPGQALSAELLSLVDVLTPNQTELQLLVEEDLTGFENLSGLNDIESAAHKLLDRGVGTVVVTLGAEGALIVTRDAAQHVPGYKVDVVDTTGAGDAFNGALAVALAERRPLAEAVDFANAAAALQVTKVGTAPAMPYRCDVEQLLDFRMS
ncbi:MAG: ribokinase [Anaerolineae bacterium]|nr:ribokinase [Anaerolineae bacterium]